MTLPAIDTLDNYGGEKEDYASVEDPTTDRAAADANQAYASVAMMTRTVCRAWLRFTGDATTPVLLDWDAVWKGSTVTDPVIAQIATGIYTITWPATVQDELGETHTLNLQAASCSTEGNWAFCSAAVTSANVVTVFIGTPAAAPPVADDMAGSNFLVWII
jgi:hypothetical protein